MEGYHRFHASRFRPDLGESSNSFPHSGDHHNGILLWPDVSMDSTNEVILLTRKVHQ